MKNVVSGLMCSRKVRSLLRIFPTAILRSPQNCSSFKIATSQRSLRNSSVIPRRVPLAPSANDEKLSSATHPLCYTARLQVWGGSMQAKDATGILRRDFLKTGAAAAAATVVAAEWLPAQTKPADPSAAFELNEMTLDAM